LLQHIDNRPGNPVTRVGDYLKWFQAVYIADITQQVIYIVSAEIECADAALALGLAEIACFGDAPDILQTTIAAERFGAFANKL